MEKTLEVVEPGKEQEAMALLAEGDAAPDIAGQPQEEAPVDYRARAEVAEQEIKKLRNDLRSQRLAQISQAQRDSRMEAIEEGQKIILAHLGGEIEAEALGPRVAAITQKAQQTTKAQQESDRVATQNDAYADIMRLASEAGLGSDPGKLAALPQMKTAMDFWDLAVTHGVEAAFPKAVEAARLVAERARLEAGKTPESRHKANLDMSSGQPASAGTEFTGRVTEEQLATPAYWEKHKDAILTAQREGRLVLK